MSRDRSAARRMAIRRLIVGREVANQAQLVELLARHGHRVTQATVSRDLAALGVVKHPAADGGEVYALNGHPQPAEPGELGDILRRFVVEIGHSRNMVVLKTPPGSAQAVASVLDRDPPRSVLGTVAGDDTVLVVTRSDNGGAALARRLESLL